MKVTVEFTGLARDIAGEKTIQLELPERATYREVVRLLAERHPGLVNILISPDRETFLSSNMFVINGDMANPAMVPDESPQEGDHLILVSLVTGG
jgi:molybdopterin converting factor small subunit